MNYSAAVITVSDKYDDTVSPAIERMLSDAGFEMIYTNILPLERAAVSSELQKCAAKLMANVVITLGGTGLSPRDITPEATLDVLDREIPAITQAMLFYSLNITPRAMLTHAVAGVRDKSLIINLPGSEKAAKENLSAIIGTLRHAVQMVSGGDN